jgi:LPS-assembly protein
MEKTPAGARESFPLLRPSVRRAAALGLLGLALGASAAVIPPRPSLGPWDPASSGPAREQEERDGRPAPQEGQAFSLGEIRVVARNHQRTAEKVYASGAVEVHYKDVVLMAEWIEVDPETLDILAEGNVVIQSSGEVLQAERVFFNLESGRGRIEKASGMIQPSLLFEAESAEKSAPDFFRLRTARVTTCLQPTPRWGFSFSRAEVKTDDTLKMWNAVLRVKNVPVFYLPYLSYPLEKARASGFLTPRIGHSGPKGFQLSQSYYWAIARNMDATVGVDVYSRLGIGAGLEYRYLFSKGTQGQASLYFFRAKADAAGSSLSNSSIIRLDHAQALPLGFKLVAKVDYQSSFDFLKEFDDDFRRSVVSNRNSQVYLTRSWARFNLSARVSRYETYYSERDDSVVTTYLPQLSFNVFKVKLISPLQFSLASSFNSWRYGWRSEYDSGAEKRSSTLLLSPTLSLPLTPVPWLTANAAVTANLSQYGQSLDPESGEVLSDPLFAWNAVVKIDLIGPVFTRIYPGKNGRPRLKHVIEPSVSYTYESPVDQADRIVTPYGYFRYHQLRYGLTNRFLIKGGDQVHEVLTAAIEQTFYLSPEDGPLARFPVDGVPPRFSEITGRLRFYPRARFSLDVSAGYNPYYRNLSTLRLSANAGSKSEGRFLSLSWFKSNNSWITGADPALNELYNRHQLSLYGGFPVPGLSLDVIGDIDFNIEDGRLLYTGARVVYHYQCLDFVFEGKVFHYRQRPEFQFKFSLGLGNIGRTMDFLSGFGF